MGKKEKDEERGSVGRAGLGGRILWDTHDGREAQSRLTEHGSDGERERRKELQNSKTAEKGKKKN